MSDYSISWAYIVSRMESLYGIAPDNEEKVPYGEIEKRMNYIWQEYFEILYNIEFGAKIMMRLINADELKTAFPCGEYARTESVRATIDSMPTIDAEPVRHGHWIKQKYEDTEDSATYAWECSICGEGVVWRSEDDINLEKFCYNCGAKMEDEG